MNNEQKIKAKDLYFQTNLTKTQIAESLQISRTALYNWIKTENWERLKFSAEHIPAVLAENCYHILGTLTEHHLYTEGEEVEHFEESARLYLFSREEIRDCLVSSGFDHDFLPGALGGNDLWVASWTGKPGWAAERPAGGP